MKKLAKYTIELRKICDIYGREEVEKWFKDYELLYYLTPEQINQIEKANVWSKDRLATKIVNHYYMREIAHETFGLFKMRLDNQLNISMEYYNQLYESAKIQIEPLSDYKINDSMNKSKKEDTTLTEKTDNNVDETITNNAEDTNNGKSTFYKYPQTAISGNKDYATDMTETNESSNLKNNQTRSTENNTTKENTKSITNTDDYVRTITGNKLPQSDLLEKYRKTFINIDEQVINSLDNLFFMLW